MVVISYISFEGEEFSEPEPIGVKNPFDVVATMASVFIPLEAYFTEVNAHSVVMQGQEGPCSSVITFVGTEEEMLPSIIFIYHYMRQAETLSIVSPEDMILWIQAAIKERGNHPSLACEVPPLCESEELRRATLFACGITDKDDFEVGLQANTYIIALAAGYQAEFGQPFISSVKELVASGEFEIDV